MNEIITDQIKVKIIDFKPDRVKVRFLSNETEVDLSKGFFERRIDMGSYYIVNPELLPKSI